MSDFASELAPESGRLRELPRLGAMVVLFQAGPLGSGLLATLFAGVPSGEPVELELGRMGRTSGSGAGGRLLEWWSSGRAEVSQLGLATISCKKVRGLYSESNEVSVPESLIFFIAYHTAAPHHVVRGPCGEARACSGDLGIFIPAEETVVRSRVIATIPNGVTSIQQRRQSSAVNNIADRSTRRVFRLSLLRSGRRLTCIRPGDTVTCFDSSQSASRSPDGLWVGLASHVLTETDRQTDRRGAMTQKASVFIFAVSELLE
ncbi:hypothetical protein BHE74_00008789 [Ensete ventricosum]|nr:hypothetical protein BHE74_00008789 [Ensete ventricosum]